MSTGATITPVFEESHLSRGSDKLSSSIDRELSRKLNELVIVREWPRFMAFNHCGSMEKVCETRSYEVAQRVAEISVESQAREVADLFSKALRRSADLSSADPRESGSLISE